MSGVVAEVSLLTVVSVDKKNKNKMALTLAFEKKISI